MDSPRRSHEEMAEKHKTTKQKLNLRRLEGETLPEPSPVASPTSPTSPTPPPWWRWSIPPLNYRFVVVAWSISLLCYVDYMPYELPNMIITILCNSIWCILSFIGWLMHEFVVYWCIFQHNKMLLDVIITFPFIYGDFPSIPLILVITLLNKKTLFYVFLKEICPRGK
jgi:hypothetical protein